MRLLSELRHPNCTMLMGAYKNEHDVIIVTEYMKGGSVADVLHSGQVLPRLPDPGGAALTHPPTRPRPRRCEACMEGKTDEVEEPSTASDESASETLQTFRSSGVKILLPKRTPRA